MSRRYSQAVVVLYNVEYGTNISCKEEILLKLYCSKYQHGKTCLITFDMNINKILHYVQSKLMINYQIQFIIKLVWPLHRQSFKAIQQLG